MTKYEITRTCPNKYDLKTATDEATTSQHPPSGYCRWADGVGDGKGKEGNFPNELLRGAKEGN